MLTTVKQLSKTMTNQVINKTSKYNFDVFWKGINNSLLHLNFEPLITQNKLKGNFALLHWQAKPKYYRRWGLYYAPHDYYYAFDWHQLLIQGCLQPQTLQIPEAKFKTVPTAVILLQPVILELNPQINGYKLWKND